MYGFDEFSGYCLFAKNGNKTIALLYKILKQGMHNISKAIQMLQLYIETLESTDQSICTICCIASQSVFGLQNELQILFA